MDGILDKLLNAIINELGATGLLVIGLYFFLGKPLKSIGKTLTKINERLYSLIRLKDRGYANIEDIN